MGKDGRPDPMASTWFAEEVAAADVSWAFQREGQAYRHIACLEALATMVAVMALCGKDPATPFCQCDYDT